MIPWVRFKSFLIGIRLAWAIDTDRNKTASESGSSRTFRAALTGISAAAVRATQLAVAFVTVPLTIRYLGNERFGLWMTISSFLAMGAIRELAAATESDESDIEVVEN